MYRKVTDLKKVYETQFDPTAYIAEYVTDQSCPENWIIEEFFHQLFFQEKLPGKTLLDVGCGPTIRSAISASVSVPEIYLCDFLERNLNYVQKWLKNEADAPDFSQELKHVAYLEGKKDFKYLEGRVRASIKDVFYCDITADNPLHPREHEQFDIITSSLCLDCITEDKDYFKAMKHLAGLLKPGGHLALVNAIEGTVYKVGKSVLTAAWIDEEKVRNALADAKLEILEFKKHLYKSELSISDEKGLFTVLAAKF